MRWSDAVAESLFLSAHTSPLSHLAQADQQIVDAVLSNGRRLGGGFLDAALDVGGVGWREGGRRGVGPAQPRAHPTPARSSRLHFFDAPDAPTGPAGAPRDATRPSRDDACACNDA